MNEQTLIQLDGVIERVIFQNEENGYTVLSVDTGDGETPTVVGCFPFVVPGEVISAQGQWENSPSHGPQFKAVLAHCTLPDTPGRIYDYLASGGIKGIGTATASVLVSHFGADTLNVILQHPEKIAAIRGIGASKAQKFHEEFCRQTGLRHLMEFLAQYSIRPEYAVRLYKIYEDKSMDVVQENPYVLASDRIGCRFGDADNLAYNLGFEMDCPERISAAVIYEMKYNLRNGHTFLPRPKLIEAVSAMLSVSSDSVDECIEALLEEQAIVEQQVVNAQAIYLRRFYEAECYTANRLHKMAEDILGTEDGVIALQSHLEQADGIRFSVGQKDAIRFASTRRLLAITGGPGTGKTTVIRSILRYFNDLHLTTILAAPTGRAAKRMTELTGQEAFTVHRLLGATRNLEDEDVTFRKNEDDPLRCDAVILDECSMVDITLITGLLKALPADCRLLLVGDADQLPSVGPGAFFSDVLRSNAIASVYLKEVFRQSEESCIIRTAHAINRGEMPDLRQNKGDFFFLRRTDGESVTSTITELCSKRLPAGLGFHPEDIQVLTPTRVGDGGTQALNRMLQSQLNPPAPEKQEKKYGEVVFRECDKVMQIRNNYDVVWDKGEACEAILAGQKLPGSSLENGSGIFNGDVGTILRIDKQSESIWILFDDKLARYSFEQLPELEHAFAITVHKSQGSEYRAVVLAVGRAPKMLLCRDVLYTAVTRAKECLVLVGNPATVQEMVNNSHRARRYSGLRARLSGEVLS